MILSSAGRKSLTQRLLEHGTIMRRFISHIFICLMIIAIAGALSYGQTPAIEARVASVKGNALRFDVNRLMFSLKAGDTLAPGDEIETRSGNVVIALSDGSLVLVQPGSRVILQDYRTANSLRELLRIVIGRVRVKINHFGGKPNPYRVNSPTASIAVRGTEFSVFVDYTGSTEVRVHEGLVEVTNLNLPQQKVLVSKGHSVLVRPNEGIQFFSFRQSSYLNNPSDFRYANGGRDVTFNIASVTDVSSAYNSFESYLSNAYESLSPERFTAFADLHSDSLENPAYATTFNRGEAQLSLVPTWSVSRNNLTRSVSDALDAPHAFDSSYFPRASVFVPLGDTGMVVGASLEAADIDLRGGLDFLPQEDVKLTYGANTKSSFVRSSFMAAQKFGPQGRTSLGLSYSLIRGGGLRDTAYTLVDDKTVQAFSYQGETNLHNTISQFKIGVKREFAATHTIGFYYRYAAISGDSNYSAYSRIEWSNNIATTLYDTTNLRAGNASTFGVSLRGNLTNRLFYGVKSSLNYSSSATQASTEVKQNNRPTAPGSYSEDRHNTQAEARFGLGYLASQRLVLSFDVAGGLANSLWHRGLLRSLISPVTKWQSRYAFYSMHGAVQADLWKNLFATASLYALHQTQEVKYLEADQHYMPTPYDFRFYKFSEFSVGWRFPHGLSPQYIVSTDYGKTPLNHSLLLRYTIAFGKK